MNINNTKSTETKVCSTLIEPHNDKTGFCLYKNKDTDQLCSPCTADKHLGFRYTNSTIPFLLKSEISSLKPTSVNVQAGLCRTWSEAQKTGFLASQPISSCIYLIPIPEIFERKSRVMRKQTMWFPNRFDTNRAVQALKMARDWRK